GRNLSRTFSTARTIRSREMSWRCVIAIRHVIPSCEPAYPNPQAVAGPEGKVRLRDQIFHHHAVDVRQTEVAAGIAVGQFFVVKAEQPEHCGVQVVNVNAVLDGTEAELVRRSV